jgi:hypothetical protein
VEFEKITPIKEPTVVVIKEMNRASFKVLYPVCPPGSNRE